MIRIVFINPTPGVGKTLLIREIGICLSHLEKENPDPKRLKTLLKRKRFQDFEITLLDTPPKLDFLTTLALTTADYVIIPLMPARYSLEDLSKLMSFIAQTRVSCNRKLRLLGVVKVYDPFPVSSFANRKEREAEIQRTFWEKVFSSSITKPIWKVFPEDEEPREIPPEEMVHEDVFSLTMEILRRVGRREGRGL